MRSLRGRIIYFFLVILAFIPVGCMLEDPMVRGDVCPPGDMREVKDELFVSFTTLDCYENYIILADVPVSALNSCSECSTENTMLGKVLRCETDLSNACSDELSEAHRQDYANCQLYRKHRVFDTENPGSNRIAFVRDFEGKSVSFEDAQIAENARYCPLDYQRCDYEHINPADTSADAESWFGCIQTCDGGLIYCDGLEGKTVCVDPKTNTWHCGAKGTCSDSDSSSLNWIGAVCTEGICQDGICTCPKDRGYASCGDDGNDMVCYDIMHDRSHCGEGCIECKAGEVCVYGVCKENHCPADQNVCHSEENNTCSNSNEACGASCMNCKNILNLESQDSATCNSDGVCEIAACEAGYHIEMDPNDNSKQLCRPNTVTACAPPTPPASGTIDEQIKDCTNAIEFAEKVICNTNGKCEATQCKKGYQLKGVLCEETNCEQICGEHELCVDTYCRCEPGYSYCGEGIGCVDLLNDKAHCGGCKLEDVCDKDDGTATYKCEFGLCLLDSCIDGYHAYDEKCELNDDSNCGKHENDCSKIENAVEGTGICNDGKCDYECVEGFHVYDGGAKSICEKNDPENCQEHGKKCEFEFQESVSCHNEKGCQVEKCISGYHVYLNECEINTLENCKGHDIQCVANSVCDPDNGCQCADGFDACVKDENDLCVDFVSDHAHCGKCNHVCPDDADCNDSKCVCQTVGLSYCEDSNTCVDLKSDDTNCGQCGKVCGDNHKCCNGICEDITVSPNCGACNNVCNDGKVCIDKSCKCKEGDGWCSNQCVSLATESNCGKCGNACGSERLCKNGSCQCKEEGKGWCGEKCIDIMGDIKNCGGCNKECNVEHATNSCKSGKCEFKCDTGYHKYDGKGEPDSIKDCGSHGNACTGGKICTDALCKCPSGQTDCGGTCVDTNTNANHCGGCNTKCTGGKSCSSGSCKCPSGQTDCGGTCVDTKTNANHCGGCNTKCTGGKSCSGGSCKCPSGQTDCGGTCVDTSTNANHCGGCNNKCTGGKSCSGGSCKCPSGQTDCGGTCVNTSTNSSHCGGCNNQCTGGKSCSGGSCKCPSGQTDCGGTCVDTSSNASHCGGCNSRCGEGQYCSGGSCECLSGTKCGSSCVDTSNDSSHCGGCNQACGTGRYCSYGSCVCSSGTDCNGSCIDIYGSDSSNCGGCGWTCGANQYCSSGTCYSTCPAGTTGDNCSSCAPGYTPCGSDSEGYPLCLILGGVISSTYCVDYCNHTPQWGGHWTNGKGDYYVTTCSPGQTCSLASYAIGGYVQCY